MTVKRRFLSKLNKNKNGCWVFKKTLSTGYGYFYAGCLHLAHRFAYELFVGSIPKGLQIDHLCRNRACANPSHLEVVTNRENALRGRPFHDAPMLAQRNAIKTHCPKGHIYNADNTYIYKTRNGVSIRECRTCHKLRERVRRAKYARA